MFNSVIVFFIIGFFWTKIINIFGRIYFVNIRNFIFIFFNDFWGVTMIEFVGSVIFMCFWFWLLSFIRFFLMNCFLFWWIICCFVKMIIYFIVINICNILNLYSYFILRVSIFCICSNSIVVVNLVKIWNLILIDYTEIFQWCLFIYYNFGSFIIICVCII